MKTLPRIFLLLAVAFPLAAAVAPSGGCQVFQPQNGTTRPALTPLGKVDELRADWKLALRSFNDLDEAGAFRNNPEVVAIVTEIRNRVPAELDEAEKYARAGGGFNFDYFFNRARASVAAMQAERERRGVK